MSVLKVTGVTDLAGLGGFTLSSGSITANGTLKVNDININGSISGNSKYNIPSFSGQSGQFLSTNGTDLVWSSEISSGGGGGAGLRSMQVFTSNGTWSRPSNVGSIQVVVVGAGGGGSGNGESAGAGGMSRRILDVSNVSSVSVTVGNPGGGKSWALVALGGHAVKLGYTVLHYTLELSDMYVGQRYDAFFTEIPVNEIKIHKTTVKEELGNMRGKLYIKQYPAGKANVNTILAHVDKCRGQGIEPDLIVLDYADLLYTRNGKEKRDKLDDIYTSLRGMATELKIPVWTASQSNRSAARDNIIQGDQIAESYSKIMISDFALSLSRKTEDKENGTGRFHVMKNRYGADGLTFNALMDTSIGKIDFTNRINNEENSSPDGAGFTGNERRNLQRAAENIFNF